MNISPFLLERHFAKYEFDVPYQLSCSDCEPLSLSELLAMATPDAIRLWENLRFAYTESEGHPMLREAIAALDSGVNPGDVLVCVPEEGIFLVMNTLLNPGDHLIVMAPAYQSLYEIARSIGCSVSFWKAGADGRFRVEELNALIRPSTRLLVMNFPHNPTGALISQTDFLTISNICESAGIRMFSDEMYRGLEQEPSDRLPCAAVLSPGNLSLSGLSKSFALPGLRIGWLTCCDPDIKERLIRLKDYTTICSSAPSEVLAIIAIQNQERILSRNRAIIRHNIQLVNGFIDRHPHQVNWKPPMAGSVAMLGLTGQVTADGFCRELLEKYEVLAISSSLFESDLPGIRLGLGRVKFGEALSRVEALLNE